MPENSTYRVLGGELTQAQERLHRIASTLLETKRPNSAEALVLRGLMRKLPDEVPNLRSMLKIIDGGKEERAAVNS